MSHKLLDKMWLSINRHTNGSSYFFRSNRHDKGQNHKDLNHRKLPSGVDLRFEVGGTLLNKRLEDIKYNSDRPGEIHRIRKKLFLA